jgi:hypothetical protein
VGIRKISKRFNEQLMFTCIFLFIDTHFIFPLNEFCLKLEVIGTCSMIYQIFFSFLNYVISMIEFSEDMHITLCILFLHIIDKSM